MCEDGVHIGIFPDIFQGSMVCPITVAGLSVRSDSG